MLALTGITACGNTKTEQKSESKEVTQAEKKEEKTEETKYENKKVRTITDHAGNEVEVPEKIERIVIDQIPILSTYMAYHHGKAPYIVGYAGSLKQVISNTVLKDIAPELLDSQNTVQAQSDINIEEIMKLKPDVIFYNASNKEHYETLKKTGIPCVGFATVGTNGPADPTDKLPAISYWLMGSFARSSYKNLMLSASLIILGVIIIRLLIFRLNIMSLSEDEAKSLGVNVKKTRLIFIFASTLITASSISMCGQVGWIGLIIPHMARMMVGANNTHTLPFIISLGSSLMVLIEALSRTVSVIELPISVLTAIIGAPIFISLIRKTGGGFN